MVLKIINGIVYDETGRMVCIMTDMSTKEDEKLIELGSEATVAVKKFVETVEHGKFTPKSVMKTFKAILEKYQ
jgi:hypothetical protein